MMSMPTSAASSLHHHHSSMSGSATASSSSSVFSPTSVHPMEWGIAHVSRWLQTLQPASIGHSYVAKFREQGVEGDILLQLNGEALRELGVGSVGHRLILLRAIYELKRKWGIELDPEAWRPDVAQEGKGIERLALPPTIAHVASIDFVRALHERDERVWMLEQEIARLVDWLRQCTDESLTGPSTSFRLIEPLRPYLPSSKAHGSLPFPGLLRDENGFSNLRTYGSAGTLSNGALQSAPLASDVRDNDDTRPSSRGLRSAAGLTGQRAGMLSERERDQLNSPYGVPGSSFSQSGFSPTNSNTPSATPTNAHPPISITGDSTRNASSATVALGQGPSAVSTTSLPSSANGSNKNRAAGEVGSSGAGAADTPYKSFRVTLDDPCYKVLPAALKKYKINDDWRQYALFICYGTTERCLSYDEKPLLLFQKLKENKQSPVFMLRHIRDVKSPIAIANAKAAARKSPAAGSEAAQASTSSTAAPAEGSGKVANAVAKFSGTSSREASDSSTSSADKIAAHRQLAAAIIDSVPGRPRITGPASQLPNGGQGEPAESSTDKNGSSRPAAVSMPSDTFAISIYPYVSEREDEFDVAVGDTFVVKSKAKGWWVVQRDVRATGKARVDGVTYGSDGSAKNGGEIKSGWVPAGCLLETRQPLANLVSIPENLDASTEGSTLSANSSSPTTPLASKSSSDGGKSSIRNTSETDDTTVSKSSLTKYMAGVPIPPSLISSTSTEGILLMDYNDDEANIHLKKDQRLRVFKRYNHWSYCVEEGNGHVRAWLPSWYIGKVRDGSSRGAASSSGNGRGRIGSKGHTAGISASAPTSTDDTSSMHAAAITGGTLSGDHATEAATMPSTPLATAIDRSFSSYPHSLVSTPSNNTPLTSTAAAAPSSSSSSSLYPLQQQQQTRSTSPLASRVAGASAANNSPHV